jgi:hypothetical protein
MVWIGKDGRVCDVGIYSEDVESITIDRDDGARPATLAYSYDRFDRAISELAEVYGTRFKHIAALVPLKG